ncbi:MULTISPECIES: gas vesicle protein K [Bacillaceae]|uniref:gas vesicle protein K n=1 Tax=Thalassobacillus sp. C254 TaxID=1225341 RepID=UPI0006D0671C|nr:MULTISPECIES: gas vesicle protein K [Bacillaceae]
MADQELVNEHKPTGKIALDPEKAEEGLSQLVMTVIELLRQLVERQAMRRVESGSLTEEEIEKVGEALMNLEEKMEELKEIFNLDDDDLNIDLGPLGNLM